MPNKKDFKILFENEGCFVFDKPAGLVVNDANTTKDIPTLQKHLSETYPELYTPKDENEKTRLTEDGYISEFYSRAGIVHRLDKDTSGVIIVAKTWEAFEELQRQFKDREVVKKYLVLVYGVLKDGKPETEFEINAPITRNRKNREKFAVDVNGKEAVTHGKIIKIVKDEEGQEYSLIECYPKTGRTHQIRVHLAALNTPVLGDFLYSGKNRYKRNIDRIDRQFLHAFYIKFSDPISHEPIEISAPLPDDLQSVLDKLK